MSFNGKPKPLSTMKISRSALLPYSAMQMFDIVADVERYPSFLNWCEAVELLHENNNEIVAKLAIAFGKLKVQFTTRNLNTPGESIDLSLVEGPFSKFNGRWRFLALSDAACKVSIEMDFGFDNTLAPKLITNAFEKAMNAQLDAFQKRAHQLHGVCNA